MKKLTKINLPMVVKDMTPRYKVPEYSLQGDVVVH